MSDLERRLAALEARVAERDVTIAQQAATIAERDATIAKLEKRVATLETKLGQNSSNSSMPPSTDRGRNPHRNAKKGTSQKKRKKRHGGARRRELLPPEQVDALHDHFPAECGGCGKRLREPSILRPGVTRSPNSPRSARASMSIASMRSSAGADA